MLANFYDLSTAGPIAGQSGPLIVDDQLQPVWFRPLPTNVVASNLSVQTYPGEPTLAWWQGSITSTGATESGEYVVVDRRYRTVATVTGKDGWILTLHSLEIHGDDAWVTANKNIPMNLTKYGGAKNGALVDSAVQEYSLKTGKLLYTWDALDHIPLSDSHTPPPPNGFPWDAYHINSIDLEGDGTFLTSMRDTWAAYQVDKRQREDPVDARRQALELRVRPERLLRMAARRDRAGRLRGHAVRRRLLRDQRRRHLPVAERPVARPRAPARPGDEEGDVRPPVHPLRRPRRGVHGQRSVAPERKRLHRLGRRAVLLRVLEVGEAAPRRRLPVAGLELPRTPPAVDRRPVNPPAAGVQQTDGKTTVYASWNGATDVAAWRVLAGASTGQLHQVTAAPKSGFETAIAVPGSYAVFEVQALDADGKVIGTSASARASS